MYSSIALNMKKNIPLFILVAMLLVPAAFLKAQQKPYVSTPPAQSPMPMKPEMTEIWNPEVKAITPGKRAVSYTHLTLPTNREV